jgi:hypothetical protein
MASQVILSSEILYGLQYCSEDIFLHSVLCAQQKHKQLNHSEEFSSLIKLNILLTLPPGGVLF